MNGHDEFYKRAARLPLLTHEEEIALGRRIQTGDKNARNKLVRHNIRLCYKTAAFYHKRNEHLSVEDLVQAGIEGLLRAAEKYDPERGYKFSTYAMQWIRQKIVRYVEENHSRLMRVPSNQVSEYTNNRMDEEERQEYRRQHLNTASMEASLQSTEGETTLADLIADEAETPEQVSERRAMRRRIFGVMARANLSAQETVVIVYAFGFGGAPTLRTGQMAETFGVSPQRISQVKMSALEKLREALHRET